MADEMMREFKDTEETADSRRVDQMPLWKALRHPQTASDYVAGLLKLSPESVFVNKTDASENLTELEGYVTIPGVIRFKFQLQVDGRQPYQKES